MPPFERLRLDPHWREAFLAKGRAPDFRHDPRWRRESAFLRKLQEQPGFRELRERIRRQAEQLIVADGADEPLPLPRKRRPGGGRKPSFTSNEIKHLQAHYRQLLNNSPQIEDEQAVRQLGRLFSKENTEKPVPHPSTFVRHILLPVRGARRTRAETQNKDRNAK